MCCYYEKLTLIGDSFCSLGYKQMRFASTVGDFSKFARVLSLEGHPFQQEHWDPLDRVLQATTE
jgi:hypothetical protein